MLPLSVAVVPPEDAPDVVVVDEAVSSLVVNCGTGLVLIFHLNSNRSHHRLDSKLNLPKFGSLTGLV